MSDLATLITAATGLLTALGGAIVWLWARVEKRFAQVELKLAECEKREARAQRTAASHLIVIELLWQEVKRRSRGTTNDVLERAEKLLDALKEDDAK